MDLNIQQLFFRNQHSLSLFYKMGVGLIQGGQCRLMKTCLKTQKFKKLIKI